MKQKLLLISLILCLVLMGFASSNVSASSGVAAYYVGPGESYLVTLDGAERFITNTAASTIFIPARTLAEQQSFINNLPSGVLDFLTFVDPRDENIYPQVQIGTQIWMAKNLAYLPSVVGPAIGSGTTPYYYVHGYDGTSVSAAKATTNYATHGALYNWVAASSACPVGWHLPTDAEVHILEAQLSTGTCDASSYQIWDCQPAGARLVSSTYSAFPALSGGVSPCATPAGWYSLGMGHFWTSTNSSPTWSNLNLGRVLWPGNEGIWRENFTHCLGASVRCLKD